MNKYILRFFSALEERDVKYCHFKSNNNLIPAVNGVDDLDLLIDPNSIDSFNEVLAKFGMRMAHDRSTIATPFVYHFFGSDPDTGLLVHLHVYFKIVTGGSILKNHWIRSEKMLLSDRVKDPVTGVYTPSPEADCILFIIRKMIEQPSPVENFLFHRDRKNIKAELDWLVNLSSESRMLHLVERWFPTLPPTLFKECLNTLINQGPLVAKIKLGLEIRAIFTATVTSSVYAEIMRSLMFLMAHVRGKMKLVRKNRFVFPGGLLIAFVGSEASGKSTLSLESAKWLSERFDVKHVHLGKPKKNWRTKLIWQLIKVYSFTKRVLKPSKIKLRRKFNAKANLEALNLPHPLVLWLDSIDRREMVRECFRNVMQGCTVVTDRFPSDYMDGPRIVERSLITALLSKWERENYNAIPSPDLVLKVYAPLEQTLQRNSLREAPEPEDFVKARFELAKSINFKYSEMKVIDTSNDYEQTLLEVKRIIWSRSVGQIET